MILPIVLGASVFLVVNGGISRNSISARLRVVVFKEVVAGWWTFGEKKAMNQEDLGKNTICRCLNSDKLQNETFSRQMFGASTFGGDLKIPTTVLPTLRCISHKSHIYNVSENIICGVL